MDILKESLALAEYTTAIRRHLHENPELSDKLFDRYSDMMSAICMEIPAVVESISDRYEF